MSSGHEVEPGDERPSEPASEVPRRRFRRAHDGPETETESAEDEPNDDRTSEPDPEVRRRRFRRAHEHSAVALDTELAEDVVRRSAALERSDPSPVRMTPDAEERARPGPPVADRAISDALAAGFVVPEEPKRRFVRRRRVDEPDEPAADTASTADDPEPGSVTPRPVGRRRKEPSDIEAESAAVQKLESYAAEEARREREQSRALREASEAAADARALLADTVAAEQAEAARIATEQRLLAEATAAEHAESARIADEEAAEAEARASAADITASEHAELARIATEERGIAEDTAVELTEARRLAEESASEQERLVREALEGRAAAEQAASEQAEAARIAIEERLLAEATAAEQAEQARIATEERQAAEVTVLEAVAARTAAERARAEAEARIEESEAATTAATSMHELTVAALQQRLERAEQAIAEQAEARAEAERTAAEPAQRLAQTADSGSALVADVIPEPVPETQPTPEPGPTPVSQVIEGEAEPERSLTPGWADPAARAQAVDNARAMMSRTMDRFRRTTWFTEVKEPGVEPEVMSEPEAQEGAEPEPEPETAADDQDPRVAAQRATTSYACVRSDKLVAGVAGLISLGCAAAVVWIATQGKLGDQTSTVAVLAVVIVLGALLAYRRGGSTSSVRLDTEGILRLTLGGSPYAFDLSSSATEVEMVGTPGARDWRIRVLRRSMTPVAISARVVEPQEFSEAIRQWRPNL